MIARRSARRVGARSAERRDADALLDLAKARALSEAGDHKKVRALLEKKLKAGKASHEEATILMESCLILHDKACVDAIKGKHPTSKVPERRSGRSSFFAWDRVSERM